MLFYILENENESLPCTLFSLEIQHFLELQESVYSILPPKIQGWLKPWYWLFTDETSTGIAKISLCLSTLGKHFTNYVSPKHKV